MRARVVTLVAGAAVVTGGLFIATADISGQAAAPVKRPAAASGIPRKSDGKPDLQGTYDIGTITPLQRPAGTPLVITEDEAAKREQQVADRSENLNRPIDANRAAPPGSIFVGLKALQVPCRAL